MGLRETKERARGRHVDVHLISHQVFTEHLLHTAHCPGTKGTLVSKTECTLM